MCGWAIFLILSLKNIITTFSLPRRIVLEGIASALREEKGIKGKRIGKGETKLLLSGGNMIIYIQNQKIVDEL